MAGPRIRKIEIQGFRSFGQESQTLAFPSLLAAVWGPNSQGKTSLAEAFEFLLTGQIVRRDLLASSQDEFADALRNAHLPSSTQTFVRVELEGSDGVMHSIKRRLVADYGKKQDCKTTLEIDGKTANEKAFEGLGIVLSQPPLRAPVLAQHTLGYLFSARPQDRADYFRALLEVTDLETFRTAVAALEAEVKVADDPLLAKLDAAVAIPAASSSLVPLKTKVPATAEMAQAFIAATGGLIAAASGTVPAGADERLAQVEEILAEKRAKTFPIKGFDKQPLGKWTTPDAARIEALAAYLTERMKVDEETRRLMRLFSEALALPSVAGAESPIDCPLCATEGSLTPARIAHIREHVKNTGTFREAENTVREALGAIRNSAESAAKLIDDALPRVMLFPAKRRRERGFRVDRIRTLLGSQAAAAVSAWLLEMRQLWRARSTVVRISRRTLAEIDGYTANLDSLTDATELWNRLTALAGAFQALSERLPAYTAAEAAVAGPLKAVVDTASQTIGWQDLIDLTSQQAGLRAALVEQAACVQVKKELDQALKQIDKGNEAVLDAKFQELSGAIMMWWNLLRPDEMSFFSAVKPRPGARRTIDFKAGLSTKPDRSNPKLRDVIAVFSQSQLHCLGLALFIARSVHEGAGFVVLDDPILSSDEDYRAYFNTGVVEKLLELDVQVILLTQDDKSWKDLGHRYLHKKIAMFQLYLANPGEGTVVSNTDDDMITRLTKIETLARGGHPDLRKQAGEELRNVGERFCKEVLVRDQWAKGDSTAAISDYDGKNLGDLGPKVDPLLVKDPAHPGKLRAFRDGVNPAKHDGGIPSQATLKVALGDLRVLKKEYL
jgi:AAA domain